MAVIYEVELEVALGIEAAYRAWLGAHVAEILALPGFLSAQRFERREPPAPEGHFAVVVQYRLHDAQALEDYLREHAPRLRADGEARFGGRFTARRRVLAEA